MQCPNCGADVDIYSVPDHPEKRVLTELRHCACGKSMRLRSKEGWDRWYAIDMFNTKDDPTKLEKLPGSGEYIDRALDELYEL